LTFADQPVAVLDAVISGHIHPSICQTPNGVLVVVYQGKEVLMCARSTDGGQTWTTPVAIATTAKRQVPRLVIGGGVELFLGEATQNSITVGWSSEFVSGRLSIWRTRPGQYTPTLEVRMGVGRFCSLTIQGTEYERLPGWRTQVARQSE
jgi:hypothetical protein